MIKEVRIVLRIILVMRLGSWFVVVNVEEIVGLSDELMRMLCRKFVMWEISVVIVMDLVV